MRIFVAATVGGLVLRVGAQGFGRPLGARKRREVDKLVKSLESGAHVFDVLPAFDVYQDAMLGVTSRRRAAEGRRMAEPRRKPGMRLSCGGYTTGGQDAISAKPDFFAVADGVGGCSTSPSDFARYLTEQAGEVWNLTKEAGNLPDAISAEDWNRAIMRDAQLQAIIRREEELEELLDRTGIMDEQQRESASNLDVTSTFLVGYAAQNGTELHVGNIGDGSVSVHRRTSKTRYRRSMSMVTEPEEMADNCPMQVACLKHDGDSHTFYRSPLREGDLVVAASDGFIDNMYFGELDDLLTRAISPFESEQISENEALVAAVSRGHSTARGDAPAYKGKRLLRKLNPTAAAATNGKMSFLPTFPVFDNGAAQCGPSAAEQQYLPLGGRFEKLKYATPPAVLAKLLVLAARWRAAYSKEKSPFWLDASLLDKYGGLNAWTGKADDVTVAVCWAVGPETYPMPWEEVARNTHA